MTELGKNHNIGNTTQAKNHHKFVIQVGNDDPHSEPHWVFLQSTIFN